MADKKRSIAYGKAGGEGNQGQGLTRFEIGGDPSEYFPIWAAGSMNTTTPAHLLEADGASYRYGTVKVGGATNLFSDGSVLRSLIAAGTQMSPNGSDLSLLLGGTGAGKFDAILNGVQQGCFVATTNFGLIGQGILVNGEWCAQDTTLAANHYGAFYMEAFTFAASTVTAANASTAITVTLANGLTSAATLTGPYGYTPSMNAPRIGDLIEIVDGGNSRFFRFAKISSGTAAQIFPAYTGTGGAGLTYRLWRTGYGSWSNAVMINVNNGIQCYYAGNTLINQGGFSAGVSSVGTVQCINFGNAGLTHSTAPRAGGADLQAVDVAYYKGYLLYGAGGAIGWSVGAFPTNVNAPFFSSGDFPAGNISAFDLTGGFLYFQQAGEQLLAFFEDSTWLVQATGGIPEFTFYRLPNLPLALLPGITDAQTFDGIGGGNTAIAYTRPSTVGTGVIYYASEGGWMQSAGTDGQRISVPVDTFDNVQNDESRMATYDRGTQALVLLDRGGTRALWYQREFDYWAQLDLSALGAVRGLASLPVAFSNPGGVNIVPGYGSRRFRQSTLAYWLSSRTYGLELVQVDLDNTTTSLIPWTWATPIVSVGDMYDPFQFGGLRVWARGAVGQSPSLTWTVYGGVSPYDMNIRDTGTFAYATGTISSRGLLSKKLDDPFIGVVLTGSKWIELAGVAIYNAATRARR